MNVIKKSDILDCYNYDGYGGSEIIGMIVYEEIPTLKAIPLDKVKQAREEIENSATYDGYIDMVDVLEILNKLIESEE